MMIKNIILLTKISTRNFFENFHLVDKKNKKINKKSMYVWLVVIVMIAITYLSNEVLNILQEYGQMQLFLNVLFTIVIIIMFMQTIVVSMNVLYFSKDMEYFLPLPIKEQDLLFSKVNTIMNILYGTELMFMLIPLLLYGMSTTAPLIYYISVIIVLVLLPIFPSALVSIIALVIMKFIKTIKSKNKFQILITVFFIILIVFAEIWFMKGITSSQLEYNAIENSISNISENINRSMIVINPLISILLQNSVLINLLKVITIYTIMYGILMIIGKKTYIKGILKTTGYSKNKHRKEVNYNTQCKSEKVLKSYIKNDFKNFIKNAIFFMQTVYPICMILLMFLFLTLYFKFTIIANNIELSNMLEEMQLTIEGVCIMLGIAQIVFSIGGISISAISRQGKSATFMKYIPIPIYQQVLLKNIPQVSINIITTIVILICAKILFVNISMGSIICIFFLSVIMSILNSYLMLIVDIKRPMLDWNSEIEVLKQNGNKIFQYVWTIFITILLMYMAKLFKNINLYIAMLLVFVVFFIIVFIVDKYVRKQIKKNKLLKNII